MIYDKLPITISEQVEWLFSCGLEFNDRDLTLHRLNKSSKSLATLELCDKKNVIKQVGWIKEQRDRSIIFVGSVTLFLEPTYLSKWTGIRDRYLGCVDERGQA
ncbi:MAG: hypothetical protein BMS9Abin31_0405 [Gammaproteobacteria bacterium]|nr:MAG: hypothetical protein BMS9Abin31_0405 [Gammaproteobacteria bacterium]